MIEITKSETADTRTCDFANTSKETLLSSSRQHIGDIVKALAFFTSKIVEAAGEHDYDKLTLIDWFHQDFVTGFEQTGWWDNHRKIHRHHIDKEDGVPENVNLLDVLEHIADCVMAGMARSGSVYELKLPDELLQRAFHNTVKLLKDQVKIRGGTGDVVAMKTVPTPKSKTSPSSAVAAEQKEDTERLNWLETNGSWLGDENLKAKWTISIPTPDRNLSSPTRLRQAIDAARTET